MVHGRGDRLGPFVSVDGDTHIPPLCGCAGCDNDFLPENLCKRVHLSFHIIEDLRFDVPAGTIQQRCLLELPHDCERSAAPNDLPWSRQPCCGISKPNPCLGDLSIRCCAAEVSLGPTIEILSECQDRDRLRHGAQSPAMPVSSKKPLSVGSS